MNLVSVLRETFSLVRQDIRPLLYATVASAVAMTLVFFLFYWVIETLLGMPIEVSLEQASEGFMILQLVMVVVTAPVEAGLAYIGLQRALGKPASASDMLRVLPLTAPLLLISLITGMVGQLGFALFFMLGLGLMVLLSQANLYYVVNRTSPVRSIIDSARVMLKHLLPAFGAYSLAVLGLITAFWPLAMVMGSQMQGGSADGTTELLASVVTLLALCWMIPFFFQLKGVLYKHLFVVKGESKLNPDTTTDGGGKGHFEA
ncbi:hypothetical protein FCL40_05005 [Ferrimonas sediminicola]|uniref:Membrane domain of glycerophosphoryl diester phosphodiesterase n=1 Tax=Ferrimonas sediminicola TaxID=2569538 RepID=A0A4U1BH17_9GAMM|nr:hypothetical protein [Ferrimonas sediminicola]TKB50511.1 hypothetical protein FCL40_05005 [Ferrimonas sediminicola]